MEGILILVFLLIILFLFKINEPFNDNNNSKNEEDCTKLTGKCDSSLCTENCKIVRYENKDDECYCIKRI